jgi:predicted PurR-regulated permease PerM
VTGDVPPIVDRLASWGWRLIVIAVAGLGVLWLIGRLRLVLFPVVVALLLTRALMPVADALRRRGLPNALAAAATLLGLLAALCVTVALIAPAVADEFRSLGPTVSKAVDDVERWIVEDSGLDISATDLDRARAEIGDRFAEWVRGSTDRIAAGAVIVAEVLAGLVLSLFLTFFCLKDGRRFAAWTLSFVPDGSRSRAEQLASRSWDVIGAYLRGAAILGFVEGIVIGVSVALVGGALAIPLGIVTLLAAFVPFVGAIVAGVLAVLVVLATAGLGGALVVAVVALVVQQLDNDLLAPVIYGRSLQLHPAAIILSVAAGGALFGLPGTFLAVPVVAVAAAIASEPRSSTRADAS